MDPAIPTSQIFLAPQAISPSRMKAAEEDPGVLLRIPISISLKSSIVKGLLVPYSHSFGIPWKVY